MVKRSRKRQASYTINFSSKATTTTLKEHTHQNVQPSREETMM